jgi:hypothetical protein
MARDSPPRRTTQLDTAEREHLEGVVARMRERVEDNVTFQLAREGLDDEPTDRESLDERTARLVEAIELEAEEGWDEAVEAYVTGVGYTAVNRLAALRCMEVRGFLDEEVTVFTADGLTPAAETLVREEFLLESEALLRAYRDACDALADEIGILFDRSSAYSLLDPDEDTFEDLCALLDEVPDEVWRADDVLGWVYEYYNRPVVEALDAKRTLEPGDVGPANQFYTPHWVVRTLTDNSLGKLYLEATDGDAGAARGSVTDRKERPVTPEECPDVASLCTYLLPDEDGGEAPAVDDPTEIRVIDPACGSGHFLLYAFDVLERIWWAETDCDRAAVPAKILEHNLHGVDLDLRSCQLAAFNLYLKARTRTEAEGGDFEMPNVGIVCADARVAETEAALDAIDDITEADSGLRDALEGVMADFRERDALGSLLDVRGAIEDEFLDAQTTLFDSFDGTHTLSGFMSDLRDAVDARTGESFAARNLRSVLHLLVVLTQEYDVALMNPPYGSGGRMPDAVRAYVEDHYEYTPEYYINFFEACDRLVSENGRIGMLVPRSFMFQRSFEAFREDFVGGRGSVDFLAEFGNGILDNATVRTVGTVVRSTPDPDGRGTFFRLHDCDAAEKERAFLRAAFDDPVDDGVCRRFDRDLSEFTAIPGMPLSYWVPKSLRDLYDADTHLDADRGGVDGGSLGEVVSGLCTGDDGRFVRQFWEAGGDANWVPFAKGGSDAWLLPRVEYVVNWARREMESQSGARVQNADYYFSEGLSYTVAKETGRRFGYLHESSIFSNKGSVLIPDEAIWHALSYANSHLFTYLMLAQTPERMWQVGAVSKVPWHEGVADDDELERLSTEAVGLLLSLRQYDFVSPHYSGPLLLAVLGEGDALDLYDHPHRALRGRLTLQTPEALSPDASMRDLGVAAARHRAAVEAELQSRAAAIDEAVFDAFDIAEGDRETVLQEIALRTSENPRENGTPTPESVDSPPADFPEMVKDLLLHLALRAVRDADDGIVPISDVAGEDTVLDCIEAAFEGLFGAHAADRLAEVDAVLGSRPADEEAYPNLRAWLEDDLFEYHVRAFRRTPVVWQLTTDRLVADPEGVGFACLVDYHQLDASVLDRLRNRYLEPRQALLRDRRSAADSRRTDDASSAAERARASEAYDRCESGLEQVAVFEERLAALARPSPRDWPDANRDLAREAADAVARFRAETADRLATLDDLAETDIDMADAFSPTFYERVEANRDDWLAALEELERAFEAYARPDTDPVAPNHYDAFEYYDDLVGSAHYASNGILFMTYYFEGIEAPDGGVSDDVPRSRRLLSELADGVEAYRTLAADIGECCVSVAADVPDEWVDRALSELTTQGYSPNRKHGVEINVRPLADAELVPETVDDDVL